MGLTNDAAVQLTKSMLIKYNTTTGQMLKNGDNWIYTYYGKNPVTVTGHIKDGKLLSTNIMPGFREKRSSGAKVNLIYDDL